MKDAKIKYYPVGNGDTSLISLTDDTKIIIDINYTNDAKDDSVKDRFDIKSDLLAEVLTDDDVPFADVFILTHPDNDHCRGIDKVFYLGDPNDYKEKHLEEELIRIDELWFSPRVFTEYHKDLNEDAKAFKKEADRRIELHKSDDEEKNLPGNRIKIIGYSNDADLEGLEDLLFIPGHSINDINASSKKDFSFFVHAPFEEDTDENDDRNDTSIVLQARFDLDKTKKAGLAFFGGDASWEIWEKILNEREDADLEWDLFLAPHHCSWTFFNHTTEEGKKEAKKSSLDILDKRRAGTPSVIVSSFKIEDNDNDPPSYQAKKEYVNKVKKDNFYVTSEYPDDKKPLPIVFRFTTNGPQKLCTKKSDSVSKSAMIGSAVNTPSTYGCK